MHRSVDLAPGHEYWTQANLESESIERPKAPRGEVIRCHLEHCDESEGLEGMQCLLEATTEVIIVDLEDGTSPLLAAEDPSKAGIEERAC